MANRKNNKCIVFINQGSDSYKEKLAKIGSELSQSSQVIDKIQISSLLACLALNFLFSIKNIFFLIRFLRNYRLRNVFFDGLRVRNKQDSISYRIAYAIYYYLIGNYLSSRLCKKSKNWVVIPDEAYGNALIACLCSRENCIILSNFTDTKNNSLPYCNISTFNSPKKYKYFDRRLLNLNNIKISNLQFEWVQEFFASLKNQNNKARSDWIGDLSKGNNFDADTAISTTANNKSAVVVCGHILCDFPAARNWAYVSFEAWLADILPKLRNRFKAVHYKPHPATGRYFGEESRLSELYKNKSFQGVDILSATDAIDLKSYAAIFSANGSVLIEASIQGASAFSSADGMTCRLPNVSYVRDVEEIDLCAAEAETKEFDMAKYAPILFYWYCREFQNIHNYSEWVYNLIDLTSCKIEENMVYQYCDVDETQVGIIPTHA